MKYRLFIASVIAAMAAVSCGCESTEEKPVSWGSPKADETPELNAADSMKQAPHNAPLQLALERYVAKKDGMIGICVITDSLV